MVTYDQQQFSDFYRLWEDELMDGEHYSSDWPIYRSPSASKLVREKAMSYGSLPAVSLFIRAFVELRASGTIHPLRAAKPAETEFVLTKEIYNKLPAAEIIRRYRSDSDFKAGVDALIQKGLIALLMGISLSGVFHL